MKIFVQIVDTHTGIYQAGMIEEPVMKGMEISNALKHFGVFENEIYWYYESNRFGMDDSSEKYKNTTSKFGKIEGTTKVVSVIQIK